MNSSTADPPARAFRDHFHKLSSGAHINRLRHHLAAPIVDLALGNSFHEKNVIHLASWIEKHRVTDFSLSNERSERKGKKNQRGKQGRRDRIRLAVAEKTQHGRWLRIRHDKKISAV